MQVPLFELSNYSNTELACEQGEGKGEKGEKEERRKGEPVLEYINISKEGIWNFCQKSDGRSGP